MRPSTEEVSGFTDAWVPSTRDLVVWFMGGFAMALFLIITQSVAVNGLAGLLLVGENAELRPFVEEILGTVPLASDYGHDGQIYFSIAHDLDGDVVGDLIQNPGIRYRRPVLPVLSSLGGLLTGRAVLYSTAFWIAAGFGATAAAFRALCQYWGVSARWAVVLFIYPGFWMATRLLTPDMIGLGLAFAGIAIFLRGNPLIALGLLVGASLTKEVFLVFPLAIAAHSFFGGNRRWGLLTGGISTAVVVGYSAFVVTRFDVEPVDGNFGMPFAGLLDARSTWSTTSFRDQAYVYMTLVVLAAALVALIVSKNRLLKWMLAPWIMVAAFSSDWIWGIGNGVVRSFAPVVLFVSLAVALKVEGASNGSSRREERTAGSLET